ncbi:MAG: cyclic nucleotide-binding domain-containing protein [Chromatiales bacterium]|nr:cyclic nucleotide-binding domain-containing protein [Chromatiales bacterium]
MNNQVLRQFVPLNELTSDNLQELARKTPIESIAKGKAIFKRGDSDNYSFYLLSGEMLLLGGDGEKKTIRGGMAQTRFPLEHHRPRRYTAIAESDCNFFRIDNDMLDILLTWDQNAGMMVADLNEGGSGDSDDEEASDWMTMMLRSEIFHRIPPTNIQAVFMHMEELPVKKGQAIIKQGEDGDYYYFIERGKCIVTHTTKSGKEIRLAELDAGNGFGEEALISDNKRNANVTMLTDGVLMRMAKEHFVELLKAPVLQTVDFKQASELVKNGAVWLDVRLESEHNNVAIPNSLNIPLYLLRIKSSELNPDTKYIVYCDTGRRSSSAAYLLNERGFDACYLGGGLRSLKKDDTPEEA